ncbi:MAG: LCP family protein [Herbinix sp.]|nr:LCP family protein [Herbinix sp.]
MQKNNDNKNKNDQKWIEVPSFVNKGSDVNQLSGRLRKGIEYDDDSSAFVREVNSSLAKQVSDFEDKTSSRDKRYKKKHKRSKVIKITIFSLLSITALCCLLMFTNTGRKLIIGVVGKYIYNNLDYQGSDSQETNGTSGTADEATDKIVNILLIGIEEIKDAQNTDSMIIATMNTEDHSLKLTSLMRDLYVHIPGHDDNRLNAAYSKGGIETLYDTIELNFGITIDGYCIVNFDAFQQIVDLIHGVEVTLTAEEAEYLNTTNYISDPANRTVVEGTQVLNGNQALGYCRVRKRPTATESNDFGRTQRQRLVLDAIYDKVKNKNVIELALLMNKILTDKGIPIETDITQDEFNRYLEEAMNLKVKELETLRIPTDDNYENVIINKKDVLQPLDWDITREVIHSFIYGDTSDTESATTNSETTE